MDLSAESFYLNLKTQNIDLTDEQLQKAAKFAEILHRENEKQNLTRILGVDSFYEGHLLDVIELMKLSSLGKRVLDIGSGCGVPGLLGAAIDSSSPRTWLLSDSEQSKAEYLDLAARELNLSGVSASFRRAEETISAFKPDTVVARAVGTVEKIAGWISNCSTWNNLILFKSKGWEEEWKIAQQSRFGKKLTVTQLHEYSSGDKYRIIVTLTRK